MNTQQYYRHKYDLRIRLFYTLLKKGDKKTFFYKGKKFSFLPFSKVIKC